MIATTQSSISYGGNNSTSTPYPVPFPFISPQHVRAVVTDENGVSTPLAYGSGYSVAGLVDIHGRFTGGRLKTVDPVPASSMLSIRRITPAVQPTDFVQGGRLSAEALETALDLVVMVAQEAVRDATHEGESNVSAAGTGLIAQTEPDVFAARFISAAEGSGISIENGDAVAGNPVVGWSAAGFGAAPEAGDGDALLLVTPEGPKLLPPSALLDRPAFKTLEIPLSAAFAGGGSTGITVADSRIDFTHDSTGAAFVPFSVPEDYAGGEIRFKFRNYLHNGVNSEQWAQAVGVYGFTGPTSISLVTGSLATHVETHLGADARSQAMGVGAGLAAGQHYLLYISRSGGHPDDDTTRTSVVSAVRLQYQSVPDLAGW